MEREVSKISRDIDRLSDKVSKIESSISNLERKLDELMRETGAKSGKILAKQIDDIQNTISRSGSDMNKISNEVSEVRRTSTNMEAMLTELRQAISLIYRNTDELEEKIIGSERETY